MTPQEQIATLELEVVRLREALHYSLGAWHYDGISDEHGSIYQEATDRLDTPFTPTVLPTLIEKVEKLTIERCVEELDVGEYFYPRVQIRAIPTGQIDLKELI